MIQATTYDYDYEIRQPKKEGRNLEFLPEGRW